MSVPTWPTKLEQVRWLRSTYNGWTSMNEPAAARTVSVASSETDEVRLPADAAAAIGSDATMTLGPGDVVTLRPRTSAARRPLRTMAEIVAATGARPIDDISVLRPSVTPLSADERAALQALLSEE